MSWSKGKEEAKEVGAVEDYATGYRSEEGKGVQHIEASSSASALRSTVYTVGVDGG